MTAPIELPPYFALLSYNIYGKTFERDLAIAECTALARGTAAHPLDERIMGLQAPVSIRHAAFTSVLAEMIAAAPTLEGLCSRLVSRQVSATDFKIIVRKIPKRLAGAGAAPQLQAAVARHIRGRPNLDSPATRFLVATGRGLWLGKILEECEDRWRLHRVRPAPYIRALPTRVACAMIGLVGRPGDRIVDPCRGAGTFLIEAADMGIQAEGTDIAPKMVSASNINLQHFGLAPTARLADAQAPGPLGTRWSRTRPTATSATTRTPRTHPTSCATSSPSPRASPWSPRTRRSRPLQGRAALAPPPSRRSLCRCPEA